MGKHEDLVQHLRDKVECPVCLNVPKKVPIPVCPNGHVVCSECVKEKCPTCRVKMEQGKSSLAVTVLENIDHECENEGCKEKLSFGKLVSHGKSCSFRLVECPAIYECKEKEKISLASPSGVRLSQGEQDHVLRDASCGGVYSFSGKD